MGWFTVSPQSILFASTQFKTQIYTHLRFFRNLNFFSVECNQPVFWLMDMICNMWKIQEDILRQSKPHISKTLCKAIMKRSQLKNKADKTRNATDILNYKKQRNYVVKLNNQCEKDHFDRLNPEQDSNTFWKSCKPYVNHTF